MDVENDNEAEAALHNEVVRRAERAVLSVLGGDSVDAYVARMKDQPLHERLVSLFKELTRVRDCWNFRDIADPIRTQMSKVFMKRTLEELAPLSSDGPGDLDEEVDRQLRIFSNWQYKKDRGYSEIDKAVKEAVGPYSSSAVEQLMAIAVRMIKAEPEMRRGDFAKCLQVTCDFPAVTLCVYEALLTASIKGVKASSPFPLMMVKPAYHGGGSGSTREYAGDLIDWVNRADGLAFGDAGYVNKYDAAYVFAVTMYPLILWPRQPEDVCTALLSKLVSKVPRILEGKMGPRLPGPQTGFTNWYVDHNVTDIPPWNEFLHCMLLHKQEDRLLPQYSPHPLLSEAMRSFRDFKAAYAICKTRDPTLDLLKRVVHTNQAASFKMLCQFKHLGAYLQNACHLVILSPASFESAFVAQGDLEDPPYLLNHLEIQSEPILRALSGEMQTLIFGACGHKGEVKVPSLSVTHEELQYYNETIGPRGWCTRANSRAVQWRKYERRCYVRYYLWKKVLWACRVRPYALWWLEVHAMEEGRAEFLLNSAGKQVAAMVGSDAQELRNEHDEPMVDEEQQAEEIRATKRLKDATLKTAFAQHVAESHVVAAMLAQRKAQREQLSDSDSD